MTSTTAQPRDRIGQYAAVPRPEPEGVELVLDDDAYNADGTFAYPPYPRSAEQVIAFWDRVPVPDQALARVQDAYAVAQRAWLDAQLKAWVDAHPIPPEWNKKGKLSAERSQWYVDIAAEELRLKDVRNQELPARFARAAARAARMRLDAQVLRSEIGWDCEEGAAAEQAVLDHRIDTGLAGTPTVADVLRTYPADELPPETWAG
jgi:hypothetical protein